MKNMENYFFETINETDDDRFLVLIIYDIIDNKKRTNFAKYLQGYGFRIQKSAFEALIYKSVFNRMLEGLPKFVSDEDSIRVYRIIGKGQIYNFGKEPDSVTEEVVVI